jgi:hypothetical protein
MAMAPNRRGGRSRHCRAANRVEPAVIGLVQRMEFYATMLKANFTRGALAVAFTLLYRHLNAETGRCNPSAPTLAAETGLTVRGIEKAIAELRGSGWWQISGGGGRGHSNNYGPHLEKVNASSGFRVGKAEQPFGVLTQETPNRRVKNPEPQFGRTSKNQNHTIDVHRSVARSGELEGQDAASSDFDIFWKIYPHRGSFSDPKKPARLKFEAAIRRGVDPAAIIAGAERHRAHVEQQGTEPKFRPQAKTWLNEERWAQVQEPEVPRLRVGMN